MSWSVSLLRAVNRLFPLPQHPFNLQNDGVKTYAEWQFEKGRDTVAFYLQFASLDELFLDKQVLDIGCGAAGKTLFYASCGVEHITGMDIVAHYEEEANALAERLGYQDKFTFVLGDAAATPFADNSFDTIIMNDAMEHVDKPEAVLSECLRILRPHGRIYINFPPYDHPYGSHLSDAIGMPWVHRFFSEKTLIQGYKELVAHLPDGQSRVDFRISKKEDGTEYFSYINHMSIRRFRGILKRLNLQPIYMHEAPLRGFLKPLAKLPVLKEFFVKMVVCVIEKE
ncbi:MAG: class I SAM-dependent methyltransferase [Clostridia bacterium]|nr:class I SAM-dependent methyltransferase [Clostridia bacterium]